MLVCTVSGLTCVYRFIDIMCVCEAREIQTLSVSFASLGSVKTSPASLVEISDAKSQVTVGMVIGLGWDSMVAICL